MYKINERRVRRKECEEKTSCEETLEDCSISTMSEGVEEEDTDIEEENEEDREFLNDEE